MMWESYSELPEWVAQAWSAAGQKGDLSVVC
jgi:hypothetical protein